MLYSELFNKTLHDLTDINRAWKWSSSPELDIQILMEKAFGITRAQFWISKHQPIVNQNGLRKFHGYVARLKKHEPMAYISKKSRFTTPISM